MFTVSIVLFAFAVIGLAVLSLVRKLAGPATVSECDPEWVSNFTVSQYRPMLRLLDNADYEFLASQAGYSRKLVSKLRRQRRRIFRAYLRNLVRDFHRLHMAGRMMLVYAPADRPELAAKLVKQRLVFTMAVVAVEFRLVLHTFGWGTVDVRQLVGALETMRASLGQFTALPQPSAA